MSEDSADNFIPAQHIDALLRAHDGTVALLYIWLSANDEMDYEAAAADLCITRAEAEAGFEKLARIGLYRNAAGESQKNLVCKKDDVISPKAAIAAKLTNPEFTEIVSAAQNAFGRDLSSNELRKLLNLYNHGFLPAEVLCMLLQFCREITEKRCGPAMRLSFSFFEREAKEWEKNGINTFEAADEYIRRKMKLFSDGEKAKAVLEIKDRSLTPAEEKHVTAWLESGFDEFCIKEAYDRTMLQKGSLVWPYMDRIINNWKEKGLMTLSDIQGKDRTGITAGRPGSTGDSFDYAAAMELMKNDDQRG